MIIFEQQVLFITAIPLWLLYRIINYFIRIRKNEEFQLKRELLLNAFFLYCLAVIGLTFFPLFIGNGMAGTYFNINYIPVVSTLNAIKRIQDSRVSDYMLKFWIRNIGGNLVLLLPMGLFLPIFWDRFRKIKTIALAGFSISLTIEILQLLSAFIGNARTFDIDDIILNTTGAVIGYGVFCLINKKIANFL
jgi:glycopeptide antibiotics resistance protein